MASASITKLSKEDQANVKSLFEGAAGNVTLDASLALKGQSITQGFMWNQNRNFKNLVVIDQHNWLGDLTLPYPNPLVYTNPGKPDIFIHQGPKGSKGGVVYADGEENTNRKWLVAFNWNPLKVYVEAGPIGPTDWDVVQMKLNDSEADSEAVDPVYGGKAKAEIRLAEGRSILRVWFSN